MGQPSHHSVTQKNNGFARRAIARVERILGFVVVSEELSSRLDSQAGSRWTSRRNGGKGGG
jgi:hypothetical protein